MSTPTPEQQGALTQNALVVEEEFAQGFTSVTGGATPYAAPSASNDDVDADSVGQQYFSAVRYQP
jgi:hypothetical protein